MAMITRCPQCAAAFRVVPDQLRVRSGLVRCGACGSVFDGYAGLVSEDEAAGPVRRQPPAVFRNRADMLRWQASQAGDDARQAEGDEARDEDDGPPWRAAESASDDGPSLRADVDRALPVTRGDGAEPVLRTPEAGDEGDEEDAFRPWYGADDAGPSPAPAQLDGEPAIGPIVGEQRVAHRPVPEFLDEDLQRRRRLVGRLWALAAAIALVVLVVQILVVWRNALAAALPVARPALSLLCRPVGCAVDYERRIERIAIMSSSLQPDGERAAHNATASGGVSAQGTGHLVLNVVLRNRYHRAQEWPALMLDLRDFSDTVVVRKVLMPHDYLPPTLVGQPFAAGAEVSLAVALEVRAAGINGYQIDKFFP